MKIFIPALVLCMLTLSPSALVHANVGDKEFSNSKKISTFSLTDQNGNSFTLKQLQGHWSLIYIGYTSCPDICPMTLANLAAVSKELNKLAGVDLAPKVIFLAVDPNRDTAHLKQYLNYFDPNYIGISGDKHEIDTLVRSLDAFYRITKKSPDDKDYEVSHSSTVYIINPDAELFGQINPPFNPQTTAQYLAALVSEGAQNDRQP